MTVWAKERVEQKRALVYDGEFGSMFDADDALGVLESHEELRAVVSELEDRHSKQTAEVARLRKIVDRVYRVLQVTGGLVAVAEAADKAYAIVVAGLSERSDSDEKAKT